MWASFHPILTVSKTRLDRKAAAQWWRGRVLLGDVLLLDANSEEAAWLAVGQRGEGEADPFEIAFVSDEGGDLAAWGPITEVAAELHEVVQTADEVVFASAEDGPHALLVGGL